jgi:hypothetical protein
MVDETLSTIGLIGLAVMGQVRCVCRQAAVPARAARVP